MNKIKIHNLSRKYQINKDEDFYAIRNISLIFKDKGFVSIIGKSGSGKSTILNMITALDKPTEGEVFYENKNIVKIKKKEKIEYYRNEIGILFQNYNLLEDQPAIYNVMLPLLINGESKLKAKIKAEKYLEKVGIAPTLYSKKVNLLSGGEKQRIALARVLINEPDVILCDEPTGALDSKNSVNVMELLKQYSISHLVIMVSHNLQLTNKYSDRIIELEDGRIKNDIHIKDFEDSQIIRKKKNKTSSKWINQITMSNIKKRFRRNLFSIFALLVSLTSTFVAFGFINGKDDSINNASTRLLDFGSGTISKEEVLSKGTLVSLTRMARPDIKKLLNNEKVQQNFDISPNFDAIFPSNIMIDYDEEPIEGLYLNPVYSYDEQHIDSSLIIEGELPNNSMKEVIINQAAYNLIKDRIKKDPLKERLRFNSISRYSFVDFDDTYIEDEFVFSEYVSINCVVEELSYLQTPKIYYSQVALEAYLKDYILPNYSTYFNEETTWYDRIFNVSDNNILSSYSYRLFLKDYHNADLFFNEDFKIDDLTYSSNSLTIRTSLLSFMEVAEYGILLFLGITLLGAILIIGIVSFTSYSEDHKNSAILTCLGASNSQISEIYLNESVLIGFISTILALAISLILSHVINSLISKFLFLQNLIVIPISSFYGLPYVFPIIVLAIGIFFCVLVTAVPIAFSKRISLKEELQSL